VEQDAQEVWRAQMSAPPKSVDTARQISTNPVLADLNMRLAQVDSLLATARKQYTERHPAVIALMQQRDTLRAQILDLVGRYAALAHAEPAFEAGRSPIPVSVRTFLATRMVSSKRRWRIGSRVSCCCAVTKAART